MEDKHKHRLALFMSRTDYLVFECRTCALTLQYHKTFVRALVTGKSLDEAMAPLLCTVCKKRFMMEPGSRGIGGALCRFCYYDL